MNSTRIACNSCGHPLDIPTWADSTRHQCENCGQSMFVDCLSDEVTVFPDHDFDENRTCILVPCQENAIKSHITPKAWLTAIADENNNVRRLVPWRTRLLAGNTYDAHTGNLVGYASASHLAPENRKHHRLESVGDAVSIGKKCTAHIFCAAHDRGFQSIDTRPTSVDFEKWGDTQAELIIIRSWAMDMIRDSHYQLLRPDILGGYECNVFLAGEDIIHDGNRLKLWSHYNYKKMLLDTPAVLAGTAFYYGADDWVSMSFVPVDTPNGMRKNSQGIFVCSNSQELVDDIINSDERMLISRSLATFDDLYIAPSQWEDMLQETRNQIDFRVSFRALFDDTIDIFNA